MAGQTQREYWSGKVGGEWANHAERIDVMLGPVTETLLDAAALQAGDRAIDIGCGSGATTLEIARRVGPSGAVTGVDLSPQLLAVARERAQQAKLNAEFVEADASAVTFASPFDVALSRFGVMFFDAPTQAFTHIRSTVRPGGRLAFVCWRPMADNPWATIPISAIEGMLKEPLPRPDPDAPGPYAFANPDKVERILRDSGWSDIALERWDGDISIGGGGALEDIADFVLRIGPCARAIADQKLSTTEAQQRLVDRLMPLYKNNALMIPGACWIVTARA